MRATRWLLPLILLPIPAFAADFRELVEALGQPRSAAEAVAQNTSILLTSSELCGLTLRVRKYKLDQANVIERALKVGFGEDADHEVRRIAKEIDIWWVRKDVADVERRHFCRMLDASLMRLGY